MAKKTTGKLQRLLNSNGSPIWRSKDVKSCFCHKTVGHYFYIPESVTEIEFVAHKKPHPDRVRLDLLRNGSIAVDRLAGIDWYAPTQLWIIDQLKGGAWYIECWYWEES